MVVCSNCRNQDTEMCECCIHGYADDHFEPLTKEDVLQAEKKACEELQAEKDALYDYSIQVDLSPVFMEAYGRAIKCISQDRVQFMAVQANEDHLFVTNGFIACKIYAPVPSELNGMDIVGISGNKVDISKKIRWPAEVSEAFTYRHVDKNAHLLRNSRTMDEGTVLALFSPNDSLKIYIKQEYLDLVSGVLGDIDQIGYTEKYNGLVFEGKHGLAVIMPMTIN